MKMKCKVTENDSLRNTSYTYNEDHSIKTIIDSQGFLITYNKYDKAGNLEELIYSGNKKVI